MDDHIKRLFGMDIAPSAGYVQFMRRYSRIGAAGIVLLISLLSLVYGCASPLVAPVKTSGARPQEPILLPYMDHIAVGKLNSIAFKSDEFIAVAIRLQDAGKERAIAALKDNNNGYSSVVLCRMLFEAKPGVAFRRAGLGAPFFVGNREGGWSLDPIEIVDGVPFLIVKSGWMLGGYPESSDQYLDWCVQNCEWKKERYAPVDTSKKQIALEKLLASFDKPPSVEAKEFLSSQIK